MVLKLARRYCTRIRQQAGFAELIGFGVGGVYVPTVKALSQWFRQKEFDIMVGLLMSVGNFGAVVATAPLAWAAGTWGWRPTFFLIGGITLAMAILMLTVARDSPQPGTVFGCGALTSLHGQHH